MEAKNMAVLFSGGKDSTYTVYEGMRQGYNVRYLLVMESINPDSYMFHWPNVGFTKIQAGCMGIKIVFGKTKGEKERELKDLENLIGKVKNEVGYIGTGALASKYQKERIENICKKLGLKLFAPSWGKDPEKYWDELLDIGFKVMITKVSCGGLGKEWLGRIIDKKTLKELKLIAKRNRFHLGFEGGEAESFVLDCPSFKKSIEILKGRIKWFGYSGVYLIKKAMLVGK